MSSRIIRRRTLVLVAALLAFAAGGTAVAGHMTSDVKSYTGCTYTTSGLIVNVKEGDSPLLPCQASLGQKEIHLSGGDITAVNVGPGLTGGGTNGAVTVGLNAQQSLPACSNGQVPKWNGTAWACGADNDTQYSAGTGLDLNGTTFSIEPDNLVQNDQACAGGQFAKGITSAGSLDCSTPASSGIDVWQMTRAGGGAGAGTVIALPKGEGVDLIAMPLPAGSYLMTAVATVGDRDGTAAGDEEVSVYCRLRNAAFAALPLNGSFVEIGEEVGDDGPAGTIAIHGLLSLSGPDTVRFTCTSSEGDSDPDQAADVTMTAVRVAKINNP